MVGPRRDARLQSSKAAGRKIPPETKGVSTMAAATGIFAHQPNAAQTLTSNAVKPMDSSSGSGGNSGSSSSSDSATISANDFLSLLVTEMQNQDPTADTDPNEYVNQLVQVNSLEQLISINQTLTGAFDSSSSTTTSSNAVAGEASAAPLAQSTSTGAASASAHHSASIPATLRAPGNLSVPASNPAADRVAHALDGNTHTGRASGLLPRAL